MKRILLFALLVSSNLFCQKLDTDKIDEFTGQHVKITDWEVLERSGSTIKARGINIDGQRIIELMIINDNAFSIHENEKLMFKFKNGEVVEILNIEFVLTETIGSYPYLRQQANVNYLISDQDTFDKLTNETIDKIRIYTSEGFIEDGISNRNSEKFRKMLNLIE